MSDEQYWSFGRKEIICVSLGGVGLTVLSLWGHLAPPWWYLRSRGIDKATLYAELGGYEAFRTQSLIGWAVVGAILGLVFSNVILRGR